MTYDTKQQAEDYRKVEQAIAFIHDNFKSQPGLDEIADTVHLSKFHFARLFKRWAGVSPVQFLQFITLDHAKTELLKSKSILDVSLDSGLSGSSRLHDLFVNFDAVTPGEFKAQGEGLDIEYGFCQSPFGECLTGVTKRGVCYLGFVEENRNETVKQLFATWPKANFLQNTEAAQRIVAHIFDEKKRMHSRPFNVLIKGTNFQINVWKALVKIPQGSVVSYQDVAQYIGRPKAHRAVASAVAVNPIAYLIPCHRVIAKTGKIHRYRWGMTRKKAIVGWEAAHECSID